MPTLAACLHHRVLDVSTLLAAAEAWGKPIPRVPPVHRAMADVEQSLAYARAFRAAAFGGGA
jgi:oligoribonuclease (3'-5' exoribonuclease)